MYTMYTNNEGQYSFQVLSGLLWLLFMALPIISHIRMLKSSDYKTRSNRFPIWLGLTLLGNSWAKQYEGFDPYYSSNRNAPSIPQNALGGDYFQTQSF